MSRTTVPGHLGTGGRGRARLRSAPVVLLLMVAGLVVLRPGSGAASGQAVDEASLPSGDGGARSPVAQTWLFRMAAGPDALEWADPSGFDVSGDRMAMAGPMTLDLAQRRRALWESHQTRGEAALAVLEPTLQGMADRGETLERESFPSARVIAITAAPDVLARVAAHPAVIGHQPNRRHMLPRGEEPTEVRLTAGAVHGPPQGAMPGRLALLDPQVALLPADQARARLERVDAPRAWSEGASGEGAVVAVVDSGVDWTHPALTWGYRGRDGRHDFDWFDATADPGTPGRAPIDPLGHGTHTASLAVGRVGATGWGVAPGAEWIAVRAFDGQGVATDVDLLRAGEWLLAPRDLMGGDPRPELAPDVINASWTLDNGVDPLFAPLLEAWRHAGIVAVFAAGNDEDGTGSYATIRAPGSASEALSVGAIDDRGRIWPLSRGGPTADGRIEPDLVAPGVFVVGAEPGASFGRRSGTSMAAPHVAGAAAVVHAALPENLTGDVAAIERLLGGAAMDGGAPGPDAIYGGGVLQVASAARAGMRLARVAGVVRGPHGPLSGATVWARTESASHDPDSHPVSLWWARTDAHGEFRLSLPAGTWSVYAESAGTVGTARLLTLLPGQILALDPVVSTREEGIVTGRARAAVEGRPLEATVRRVTRTLPGDPSPQAEPALAVADSDGAYRLNLGAGRHDLLFEAAGHRSVTRTVRVLSSQTATLDVAMPRSPSVLLVDADAWQAERIWPYLSQPLAATGLRPEVWTIDEPSAGLPALDELARWDIVIWAHQFGSPGRLDRRRGDDGATALLRAYVERGGRLLLTGQDVATWDSAQGLPNARLAPDFFARVLGARLVAGGAGGSPVNATGLPGMQDLSLDLDWPRGRLKGARLAPDLIEAAPDSAEVGALFSVLATYRSGGAAALGVAGTAGRRAVVAFAPESAGDQHALGRFLDGLVGWLEPPALRLRAAGAPPVDRGGRAALQVLVLPGRAAADAGIDLTWSDGLALVPGSGLTLTESGAAWQGAVVPNRALEVPFALDVAPGAQGVEHIVTATLGTQAFREVVSATVLVAAPDLRPTALTIDPPRIDRPGPVTATLAIRNTGLIAVAEVSATLRLPTAWRSGPDDAQASSGKLLWTRGGQPSWTGQVAAGETVTLMVRGVLDALPVGSLLEITSTIRESGGVPLRRRAALLFAGPQLRWVGAPTLPRSVVAGATFPLTVSLANDGPTVARADIELSLPAGVELDPEADEPPPTKAGTVHRSVRIASGDVATEVFALRVMPGALGGARRIRLVAVDDAWPPAPIATSAQLRVLRVEFDPARVLIWPRQARSGDLVTVTLLLANQGDARARTEVDDALPPTMALLSETLVADRGGASAVPGGVRWRLTLPPAAAGHGLVGVGRAAPILPVGSVPARDLFTDPSGYLRGPVDLSVGLPFGDRVYTRTWLTDDGLLLFAPPAFALPALGPQAAGAPAVAVAWRPGRGGVAPMVSAGADGLRATWSAEEDALSAVALHLAPDGSLEWSFGPTARVDDAIAGLNTADGEVLELPREARAAGQSVRVAPRLDWARLSFQARVGNTVGPNTRLENRARLLGPSGERTLADAIWVNRLSLAASRLDVEATEPEADRVVTLRLRLRAEGDVPARDVEARVRLPDGADLLPASLDEDLSILDEGRDLRWRGRLEPGEIRDLSWQMRVRPGLPAQARLMVVATLSATGVRPFERTVEFGAGGGSMASWTKQAIRTAPLPGEASPYVLHARNPLPVAARLTISDVLPVGLSYVEGSATASLGPDPEWEAASRRVSWSGEVPAGHWVFVRFVTRPTAEAGTRLLNQAWLVVAGGPATPAEAEVLVAVDRIYLPRVALGRNDR